MPLGLTVSEIPGYLPSIVANLAKRLSEKNIYDRFFQTELARRLVRLSPWKKYSLEMIMYFITAVLDKKLPENSFFRKFAKEVALDTAAEVSKRMINGAREDIKMLTAVAESPVEKEFFSAILSLEDSDIDGLIRWLSHTELEQERILRQLARFSFEQQVRFYQLSEEIKEKLVRLMDFFYPEEQLQPEKGRGVLGMMADDINKLNEKLERKERSQ